MISILMPIYNGIEFIEESVNSIKKQTFKDWELIIGINGYQPGSIVYNKAKEYENDRIKVIELYPIKGKSTALNAMIGQCNYDWVSLLDVDDIWKDTKLETQLPFMENYDVIGTLCQYFGDSRHIPRIPSGDITNFDFLKVNPIINSSCLIRKNLCEWDKVLVLEDYDLWLKLWKDRRKFYNVKSIEVLHRIHKESAFNAKGNNLHVDKLRRKYK